MNFYRFGYYFASLIAIFFAVLLIDEKRSEVAAVRSISVAPTHVAAPPAPEHKAADRSSPSSAASALSSAEPTAAATPAAEEPPAEDDHGMHRGQFRMDARISAIEKFVPLDDAQRERLRAKFQADRWDRDGDAKTETLDEILGAENAQYYRDQMNQAFSRAKMEENDRELFYQSRKLGLTADQEEQFRSALASAEEQIERERAASANERQGMRGRMQQMIREDALRGQILDERLQQVLSAEQYQRYLEQRQNSSAADFQVFHGPER